MGASTQDHGCFPRRSYASLVYLGATAVIAQARRSTIAGLREVNPTSPLGQLAGTDNVILIESQLFKGGQELLLHGPGSGLSRTVAAVKADLYLCAMEMPRHHVVGASHLF